MFVLQNYYSLAVGGGHQVIPRSVCPSVYARLGYSTLAEWRSCLGYIGTLAACRWPATRDVRTADPSADGRRSAASRTAIGGGGGMSSRRPRGDN